jgi:hypothetical protein
MDRRSAPEAENLFSSCKLIVQNSGSLNVSQPFGPLGLYRSNRTVLHEALEFLLRSPAVVGNWNRIQCLGVKLAKISMMLTNTENSPSGSEIVLKNGEIVLRIYYSYEI